MKKYLMNILISFDQFLGAFIPGSYPDETISSRAFREDWKLQGTIDWVFLKFFNDEKHCESSYWSELEGRQQFMKETNVN